MPDPTPHPFDMIRLARRGDRWRVHRTRKSAVAPGTVYWFATPVVANVYAFAGHRHATFHTRKAALDYANARHSGATHAAAGTFELSTLMRTRGAQRAAQRRAGYASRGDD